MRVYIDAPEGISVEDCELVSKRLSTLLAMEDIPASDWTLEVSSPGLDRRLFHPEQYARYIGEEVDVRLHFAVDGTRRIRGVLHSADEDKLVVDDQEIRMQHVRITRLIPNFD